MTPRDQNVVNLDGLLSRDFNIVSFVGLLRQVTSTQLRYALFADRSKTPLDRALKRLTKHRYLSVVGRRVAYEYLHGLGPYVYQLGPKGWHELSKEGRYKPYRSINEHALHVGDALVCLQVAEREGRLKILDYGLEYPVGDAIADLYVELETGKPEPDGYYLEVDLGTERSSRIWDKCAAYWRAYDFSTAPTFPYVLFVVPDKYRYDELQRVLRKLPELKRPLFKVCLARDLLMAVSGS